tara:strand:- start:6362 stop:6775 length:414 start_codon:yes stop_codon:yes gene_type:complete
MNILFLCVANSARSQMAEGLARSILPNECNIQSAGSNPSGEVHPNAVLEMDDIGIDIRDQYSKSIKDLDKEFLNNLDYVITLCAEEICPVLNNNAKKLHWLNVDPDNKNYSPVELKNSFKFARENIFKLIKKFQFNF